MMEFYKYIDTQYEDGVRVHEVKYRLVKETPCGWWIRRVGWYSSDKPHWVSKTSRKRLAYPTKEEAIKGFIAKKRRQIAILNYQLERADEAWRIAETYLKYD